MNSRLMQSQQSGEVAVYKITICAQKIIEEVDQLVENSDDIDELCNNMDRLFQQVHNTKKVSEELDEVVNNLKNGADSIYIMIEKLTATKKEEEDNLDWYEKRLNQAEVQRANAEKEYENYSQKVENAKNELEIEEKKLEEAGKQQENCKTAAKIGLGTQITGGIVGVILCFTPLAPIGVGLAISTQLGGWGTTIGAAIVCKSENEMKLLRNGVNNANDDLNRKREKLDKYEKEIEEHKSDIRRRKQRIEQNKNDLDRLKDVQKRMEACKQHVIELRLLMEPIHSNVQALCDTLSDHHSVGKSRNMTKQTISAYYRFREEWKNITNKRIYAMLKYEIDSDDDQDYVILAISC